MTKHLHFSITGEFITNAAREALFAKKDLAGAIEILRSALCTDQIDSDEQLMICLQVLHGAAAITGVSGTDSYGLEYREDIDERPTELSSISQLIAGMAEQKEKLEKEYHDLCIKFSFLADHISSWKLTDINNEYYGEYGKPMFSGLAVSPYAAARPGTIDNMLDDYMSQRKRKQESEEEVEDYGWLEPDGTWHPVPWGSHSKWAGEWLQENMPYRDHPEIYFRQMKDGSKRHISGGDVLVYSLGWILIDSPHQGKGYPTRDDSRRMPKAQKEFLYSYYIERGRNEEANRLYDEEADRVYDE